MIEKAGFVGPFCNVANPCGARPCQNGGTCVISQNNQYQCNCPPNYSGSNCELSKSLIIPHPILKYNKISTK